MADKENSDIILRATHGSNKTPIRLGLLEIPCYVLEGDIRVLSGRGIQKALGSKSASGQWLKGFVNNKTIAPFFSAGVLDNLNTPIRFIRPDAGGSQSITYGYEATLLIDIIDAIIDANIAGVYNDPNIVASANVLSKALKRVSIIALVDEATGYQNERVKNALEIILNKFILAEAKKYEVTFPLQLYKEWFRLNNWEWKEENAQKRPGVLGTWTNDLIYRRMAPGLLEELERKNPKNQKGYREHKHFEFLTDEVGEPRLREFFGGLIALARATTTWRKYMEMVNRAYPPPLEGLFKDLKD